MVTAEVRVRLDPCNNSPSNTTCFQFIERSAHLRQRPGRHRDRPNFPCSRKRDNLFEFVDAAQMRAPQRDRAQYRRSDGERDVPAEQTHQYHLAAFAQPAERHLRRCAAADKIDGAVEPARGDSL